MTYTKDAIRSLLERSDAAVEKGLLTLYARQTADEQAAGATTHHNGMGFSGFDAEFLSSLAQQIERKQRQGCRLGQCLSARQLACARQKIVRYAGQLALVANEQAAALAETPVQAVLIAA